jgi:uncharacterized membrane protein YfcA
VTPLLAVAAAAVLAGSGIQAATGFGFGLIAAPLLFAATSPQEAIGLMTILGLLLNVLTLTTEGRRPAPLRPVVRGLLIYAAPGMVAGVVVLRTLDAAVLQVLVTLGVLSALAVRRRRPPAAPPGRWTLPAVGLGSGVLATATTTSGPPIILYLMARGASPGQTRDTLAVTFVGFSLLGAAVLAATGTRGAIPDPVLLGGLATLVVAGQLAGRRVFAWLSDERYDSALTAVLLAAGVRRAVHRAALTAPKRVSPAERRTRRRRAAATRSADRTSGTRTPGGLAGGLAGRFAPVRPGCRRGEANAERGGQLAGQGRPAVQPRERGVHARAALGRHRFEQREQRALGAAASGPASGRARATPR